MNFQSLKQSLTLYIVDEKKRLKHLKKIDNLPKVVSVSSCTNMFSYEICDSVIDTRINVPAVVHAKTTITLVNPFDAQNNDTIKPIEAKTIDLPIVVEPTEAKTIDQPIVVEPIEAKTIDQPIEAKNIDLPIVVGPLRHKITFDYPLW